MPPIVTSAEIDRPAAEVFAYATDPAMDGPAGGTQTPAPGAKCVTTRRIGGANRPSTSELVRIDPPRAWGVHGVGKLLVPLMVRREARKEMPDNMAALKRRLEAS